MNDSTDISNPNIISSSSSDTASTQNAVQQRDVPPVVNTDLRPSESFRNTTSSTETNLVNQQLIYQNDKITEHSRDIGSLNEKVSSLRTEINQYSDLQDRITQLERPLLEEIYKKPIAWIVLVVLGGFISLAYFHWIPDMIDKKIAEFKNDLNKELLESSKEITENVDKKIDALNLETKNNNKATQDNDKRILKLETINQERKQQKISN